MLVVMADGGGRGDGQAGGAHDDEFRRRHYNSRFDPSLILPSSFCLNLDFRVPAAV